MYELVGVVRSCGGGPFAEGRGCGRVELLDALLGEGQDCVGELSGLSDNPVG